MKRRPNDDVREYAKKHDVRLWQVAESLGISDSMLSKRLRHDLSAEDKEEIYEAIRTISAQS